MRKSTTLKSYIAASMTKQLEMLEKFGKNYPTIRLGGILKAYIELDKQLKNYFSQAYDLELKQWASKRRELKNKQDKQPVKKGRKKTKENL